MRSDPRREIFLGKRPICGAQDSVDGFGLGRFELKIVDGEKGIGGDERGSFVPVDKGVVLGDVEGVRGCKSRQVRAGFVMPLLLRPCQGGLKQSFIANAKTPSMLQDLVSMKRLDNRAIEPGGFGRQGRRLLGEFTKGVLVLLGPAAVDSHRLLKGWIVRGNE